MGFRGSGAQAEPELWVAPLTSEYWQAFADNVCPSFIAITASTFPLTFFQKVAAIVGLSKRAFNTSTFKFWAT